jgi:hypothetical protein
MIPARTAGADPAAEGCTSVSLSGVTPDGARWRGAVLALRAAVTTLADCPEVALAWSVPEGRAGTLTLRATGRGGLSTERTVADPDALVPSALGLLATAPPEASPVVDAGPSAPPAPPPASPRPPPLAAAPPQGDVSSGVIDRAAIGATIALQLGPRIAGPTPFWMTDVELRGDLRVRSWLVMVSVRYAPLGASPGHLAFDDDAYNEMALGIGVGRRFTVGRSALDLALMSSLVAINMEKDAPVDNIGASASQGRVSISARWSAAIGARTAIVLTTDAEVAPGALGGAVTVREGMPAPPAWTFGLRVGAASDVL